MSLFNQFHAYLGWRQQNIFQRNHLARGANFVIDSIGKWYDEIHERTKSPFPLSKCQIHCTNKGPKKTLFSPKSKIFGVDDEEGDKIYRHRADDDSGLILSVYFGRWKHQRTCENVIIGLIKTSDLRIWCKRRLPLCTRRPYVPIDQNFNLN